MTLNDRMIVVGGSIPGYEIVSLLDETYLGGQAPLVFPQKEKKRKLKTMKWNNEWENRMLVEFEK